jgi:excisionase family DNA binding protein
MSEDLTGDKLLSVPQIARYMRVSEVTVYRWCREGRLPCLKLGHSWRVRHSVLDDFLARGEYSATLVGQLRSFYRVPDNLLAIAQTHEMLHRLDAAFFEVAEARGGMLVKICGPETGVSVETLRAELDRAGLEVERLEDEGRLRFVPKNDNHVTVLRRFYEETEWDRTIWASFDWVVDIDLEAALERQHELTKFVAERQLVVQTGVLEGDTDKWPPPLGRRAQLLHSATVWLSEAGLATTRVSPLAEK